MNPSQSGRRVLYIVTLSLSLAYSVSLLLSSPLNLFFFRYSVLHIASARHTFQIVVTLDRWSVHSLSRCVHTLDQVELDSQHAPSSSSRAGFGRYLKSASTRVLKSASTRINRSPLRLVLCGVAESVLRLALCGVAESLVMLRSFFSTPPQAWQVRDRQPKVCHELPESLSAPKALMKMSVV